MPLVVSMQSSGVIVRLSKRGVYAASSFSILLEISGYLPYTYHDIVKHVSFLSPFHLLRGFVFKLAAKIHTKICFLKWMFSPHVNFSMSSFIVLFAKYHNWLLLPFFLKIAGPTYSFYPFILSPTQGPSLELYCTVHWKDLMEEKVDRWASPAAGLHCFCQNECHNCAIDMFHSRNGPWWTPTMMETLNLKSLMRPWRSNPIISMKTTAIISKSIIYIL